MKKHNGMRPQDILILLKIIACITDEQNEEADDAQSVLSFIQNKSIANSLQISEAEVSESLRRSAYAGLLLDLKQKTVNKNALLEFIFYGLKYAFPSRPGALVRGVPTAHSAPL